MADHAAAEEPRETENRTHAGHRHAKHLSQTHLVSQIQNWLREEKAKRSQRAAQRSHKKDAGVTATRQENDLQDSVERRRQRSRSNSEVSEGSLALEKLEQILADSAILNDDMLLPVAKDKRGSFFSRRHSSVRKHRKASAAASSDTDYKDGDAVVPSTEVVLDNSQTLSYTGSAAGSSSGIANLSRQVTKERQEWVQFKNEIVRLTHTLKLKGWRTIPLDRGEDIDVERLSGALTNAVYVVSPPKNLPLPQSGSQGSTPSLISRKPPPQLLLRIYGPQVEHLIDRENELQILRRLARKRIGPRLLGTFTNGRFEEFFHARTLTPIDLRIPGTSKQIAKRMRELHDGIELLEDERRAGPFVWRNWDKWVARCEEVVKWIDRKVLSDGNEKKPPRPNHWKKLGLVCGVEWPVFRTTVDRYREWLDKQYGGPSKLREQLVFAHNDTQYGNLLRLQPSGESPLILPANEHKQLVVIDFEYASANLPGLEFANHFTEWCYNYHDSTRSFACNTNAFPTIDEQRRFIKTYIQHRPQFHPTASETPAVGPTTPGLSSSISSFMLDSRMGTNQTFDEEESNREEHVAREVDRLMREARLWRVANSAQWVAWGIVQAKVPEMEEAETKYKRSSPRQLLNSTMQGLDELTRAIRGSDIAPVAQDAKDKRPGGFSDPVSEEADGDEDEFDYLAYAQERAMFFWGDVLELGIVRPEDLPRELLERVKIVKY